MSTKLTNEAAAAMMYAAKMEAGRRGHALAGKPGQVASMALTEAILAVEGSVAFIRKQVEASVYWAEFCELVKAGKVDETFLPGALGVAITGWARTAEEVGP